MILYGRNAVHEALRGAARRCSRCGRPSGAAREPWLRERARAATRPPRRSSGAAARPTTRASAPRSRSTATPTPASCWPRADALIVALDEIQDPQNLGAICRTAECAGATGVVIPERRSAEVTPAVCKASAGAVEHLRDRARAQPRRLPARRAQTPAAGATAPTATRAVAYAQPDYRGGVVLVLGSEGSGLRPRVAGACDELVALPLRGRIELAQRRAPPRAALLYEIVVATRDPATASGRPALTGGP